MNSDKTYQMAITRSIIIAGVFAIMFSGVSAQGPATAPGPAMDCFTSVLNLTDCLNFVEVGSNETTPEKGCCPAFAGLVESAPRCLCDLFTKPDSYGIELNRTKALNLPSLCGVTTPPFSLCTGGSIAPASPMTPPGNSYSPSNHRVSLVSLITVLLSALVAIL
ncbi:hypothetical protein AAC387_Pa03g0876 [Persea americana]